MTEEHELQEVSETGRLVGETITNDFRDFDRGLLTVDGHASQIFTEESLDDDFRSDVLEFFNHGDRSLTIRGQSGKEFLCDLLDDRNTVLQGVEVE